MSVASHDQSAYQTLIYRLRPRGAFHFGERGVGVEETADMMHSDTLFAAVVSAWRMLGEQPVPPDNNLPVVAPFLEHHAPFHLSSAFPYAGEVLFFPRPLIPLGRHKYLKQVQFISAQVLQQIQQNTVLDSDRVQRELIQGGQVWVTPEEREKIMTLLLEGESNKHERERLAKRFQHDPTTIRLWWGRSDPPVPHVAIDRRSSASNLFFTGRVRFASGCGLYVWVKMYDSAYRERLEAALTFLQDEGVGGKRTTGHGQFIWTVHEQLLPEAADPTHWMTLSLYHPRIEEALLLNNAWYQRIHRQGWIFSPAGRNLRRKGLWMLREGSVLPDDVLGTIEDVRPDIGFVHPIWRSGHACTLPIRLENVL
jgi:CRISPR-associated protein Csm4